MKEEDVGSVPVVNNRSEKRLVGIVTDRDLTLEVVAAGRDPNSIRVEDVMTRRPVSCHPEDDSYDAMQTMSRHQVRRIPVVDDQGRLSGIIAQADLARRMDEDEVGEFVEDISQPSQNIIGRTFGRMSHSAHSMAETSSLAGVLIASGIGMAVGATLMCLFDPAQGQTRRARVSDVARNAYDQSANLMNRASKTVGRQLESGSYRRFGLGHRSRASEPLGV